MTPSRRTCVELLALLGTLSCSVTDALFSNASVQGAGPQELTALYQDAFFAYQYVQPEVQLSYTPMNSASAMCRVESYDVMCSIDDTAQPYNIDFAASLVPLQPVDYAAYPDLQMYPTAAMAVVPTYNIPGAAQPLVLTRQALAQIYIGEIRTWDDPRIASTNPNFTSWGVPAGQPIQIVVLSVLDGTTFVYKSAMSAFYHNFSNVVPVDMTSNWGPLNVTLKLSYQQVNAFVAATPYTMGYCSLGHATDFHLLTVSLGKDMSIASVTAATVTSLTYTILELGPSFGNNNDSASHLTASLWNSQGVNAWPIASYTYIVLRKDTLRTGATCATRRAVVDFFQWYWTTSMMAQLASASSMVTLPSVVQQQVLAQFLSDMECNTTTLWKAPALAQISVYGKYSGQTILMQLGEVYGLIYPQVNLSYTAASQLLSTAAVASELTTKTLVSVGYKSPQPVPGGVQLLFAGMAFAVISIYNLVLDLPTLIAILEGTVTTWMDPSILALNPAGIIDMNGNAITNRNQNITLFCGIIGKCSSWITLMQAVNPSYSGAALNKSQQFPDEVSLRSTVAGTPYSLSVTNLVTNLGSDVLAASIRRSDGNTVPLTWHNVQDCASADVYDPTYNTYYLVNSAVTTCYPLSEAIYLSAMQSECNFVTDANRSYTISFLEWLFTGTSTASVLMGENIAPLLALPNVQSANAAVLATVSCNTTASIPLGPILGGSIGALVAVMCLAAVWGYRSTKQLREMPKKLSDDNVAEECAQAIAGFNLDAVAWLQELPRPSRIQKSFLQIVGLLTEVKPFIPDQLLVTLQRTSAPESTTEGGNKPASRPRKAGGSDTRSSTPLSTVSSESGPMKEITATEGYVSSSNDSSKDTRAKRSNPKMYKPRMKVVGDFSRRMCTYLFVKYTLVDDSMNESTRVSLTSALASHVITAAKARHATIDHVAFDSVALHWNVANNTGTACSHAVALALELSGMKTILAPDRQASLRLSIGIGHGMCSVTTISAAGHRFFVVGGPAVSTAVDLVLTGCPTKVQCVALMSEAVQREVCYSNHALPRMIFEGTLLYEPIRARATGEGIDEWMYELHNMDAGEGSAFDRQLEEVFTMAREGASPSAIRQNIRTLKADHADRLTTRDHAALDLLLSGLEPTDAHRVA